ncbi:MAG: hypothetical protein ACJ76N_10370 [Thermoanaerobaculia bacterium]
MRKFILSLLLLVPFTALPVAAQLQYFGYVGSADDDVSLGKTKGYTNFAHVSTSTYIYDSFVSSRVNALSQRGSKAMIDLGYVLWCDYDGSGLYRDVCWDWYTRWSQWKSYNAAILTSSKVLAFGIRNQPFNYNVNMGDFDYLAAQVKADFPWAKLYMAEAACVIANDNCGWFPGAGAFWSYAGTLPNIDWIGIAEDGVHPSTDSTYQSALYWMRSKFPGKKWIYVMDGTQDYYGQFANEYYNLARNDPNAVMLAVFDWTNAKNFPCSTLALHVSIGRAITGKTRPHAGNPLGSFSIDSNGVVAGWSCDPDETVCEHPRVDLYVNGSFLANASYTSPPDSFANAQCGTEQAYRYRYTLPRSSAGKTVTVYGTDADSGVGQSASTCAGNPGCSWTPHLQYYGYVGGADDDSALSKTFGFTNFAQISTTANPADTVLRDRVTALAQKGSKAVIDLGLLLWCDRPGETNKWRTLCVDWLSRWNQWKSVNASILTSDKVLAFSIRDEPFNYDVTMSQFEQASAQVKADLPWAKLYVTEAACVIVYNNCGIFPGSNAFNNYQGTLPNIDWIGVDDYAIHPATDTTFRSAISRMRSKFPSKQWLYVMDGWWSGDHQAKFGSYSYMGTIAREWYNVAHDDFNAVLLGVYGWQTYSRDYPCNALSEQVNIGREVTGKVRPQTAAPVGRLEQIDYSGTAIGYACDPDGTICEDPRVDLYKNGVYATTASFPHGNDFVFNAQCSTGVAYRFRANVSWASGSPVTAYARDLDSGVSYQLPSNCANNPACIWYSTYYQPKGYMDGISSSGVASGWVCDQDAPQVSSKVRLALGNGTQIGTYTTNLGNEQAVADECGGGYLHRFSVQLPSSARYWDIHAFAQDLVPGYGEVEIPWLCPDGWYCVWY